MSSKRQLSPKQRKKKLTSCNRIVLNFIVAMCRELQAKEARSETYAWFQIYSMRYVCLGRNSINIWKFKRAYNNSFNGRRKQTKRSSRWAMQKKRAKNFFTFSHRTTNFSTWTLAVQVTEIFLFFISFFFCFCFYIRFSLFCFFFLKDLSVVDAQSRSIFIHFLDLNSPVCRL